ncbi:MAG: EAL domain-containing protein [Alphaproteobacteria bacterium]|nr:EAL domain-containing protein [Alphaproteobacteria bacterium]
MAFLNSQDKRDFKAGDIIMRQGEKGECAYIIEEGRVEIFIESDNGTIHRVGTRGPGAIIGEMAIIDDAPRTATIKAVEDCRMLEISRDDFSRRLKNTDPVIQTVSQVVLTRYRDMLARAEIFRESNSSPPPEEVERSFLEETDAVEMIKLANDFRDALRNRQLSLHYQPIIDLRSGDIQGFEALVRWEHPERGFLSPGLFIPMAEDTGLIVDASKWVLEESCRALKRIESLTGYDSGFYMSVNFSSTDFASEDFVEGLYDTLSRTDVSANRLCLEITERILMSQPESARETLEMCCKAGMKIAIDDFGTGYSSLSYLHSFPIQVLKIDRSFITEMMHKKESLELVRSIIALGKNLNMTVTAEGVENPREAQTLLEMECDSAQGFWFSRPQAEKDVIKMIRDRDKAPGKHMLPPERTAARELG